MKKISLPLSLAVVLLLNLGNVSVSSAQITKADQRKEITYKTFRVNGGWGFDLFVNKKKSIHQDNIPAINGNLPFKKRRDAVKVAKLMKAKMLKNIFPPSVTLQELDSLIKYKN